MAGYTTQLVLLVVAYFGASWAKMDNDPPCTVASLTNCGQAEGGSDFTATWSPCALTAGKPYKVTFSGTASRDFDQGFVNSTAWIVNNPQPIFNNMQAISCEKVQKISPIPLPCPVKKGDKMNPPPLQETMPTEFQMVPTGDYKIRVEILDNNKAMFLCATAQIHVENTGENDIWGSY